MAPLVDLPPTTISGRTEGNWATNAPGPLRSCTRLWLAHPFCRSAVEWCRSFGLPFRVHLRQPGDDCRRTADVLHPVIASAPNCSRRAYGRVSSTNITHIDPRRRGRDSAAWDGDDGLHRSVAPMKGDRAAKGQPAANPPVAAGPVAAVAAALPQPPPGLPPPVLSPPVLSSPLPPPGPPPPGLPPQAPPRPRANSTVVPAPFRRPAPTAQPLQPGVPD